MVESAVDGQSEMPTAIMMRKKANPRSNHETSMIEWLTGSAFWMITSIRLFSSIEEIADSGVRHALEYISGSAVLNDPPALHHDPVHRGEMIAVIVERRNRGRLVAGDTLFLDGCGRTDLPGSDPDAMYESLTQRLATVPDDTVLYPGHLYSAEPSATMGETRAHNYVFRVRGIDEWRRFMGG
jgi:hypothetical protein